MQPFRNALIFVSLGLISALSSVSRADDSSPLGPVSINLRMAGEEVELPGSQPYAAVGGVLDYNFYKTYSIGVEFAYYRPFNTFDDQAFDGTDDIGFYLVDKSLWSNRYWDMNLTVKATFILPISQASREASMISGGSESLIFKKGWGGHFSTSYWFSVNEYYYEYATAQEDDTSTVYNTRVSFLNKFVADYELYRDLHYMLSWSVKSYNDYANDNYAIYTVGTGFGYDIQKNSSIDFGVRSGVKQGGAPDPWNGPATDTYLFGPGGTIFYIGTTLKI